MKGGYYFTKFNSERVNGGALVSPGGHPTSMFLLPSIKYHQLIIRPALPNSYFC